MALSSYKHASNTLSPQHPLLRTSVGLECTFRYKFERTHYLASIGLFVLFPALLDLLISPFNFTNFHKQIMAQHLAPLHGMQINTNCYYIVFMYMCIYHMSIYVDIYIIFVCISTHVCVCVCMQKCKYLPINRAKNSTIPHCGTLCTHCPTAYIYTCAPLCG